MPVLPSRLLLALALCLTLASCGGQESPAPEAAVVAPETPRFTYRNEIVPRRQWNANSGYCGETSFICAGLFFGQYCSQFTARALASPGVSQADPKSQLLLGVNDVSAAERLRLRAQPFNSSGQSSTEEFLGWIKQRTLAGDVVVIGVFNNGVILGEWSTADGGDPQYDHIVPILGLTSTAPFHDTSPRPSDTLTLSDNGLYGPVDGRFPFLFTYSFEEFPGRREQANQPDGPIYMLRSQPPNFGIALQGPLDLDGDTVPVRLVANRDREGKFENHADSPPIPTRLQLTATVLIPDQTLAYRLYRYDDFSRVPDSRFNARADQAVEVWDIPPHSGPGFGVTWEGFSDESVIFRAVPASAP